MMRFHWKFLKIVPSWYLETIWKNETEANKKLKIGINEEAEKGIN